MDKEYSDAEDKAINKINTYEKAIRVLAKSIVEFMNEHGAPPPMDILYGTVSKIAKKFNKDDEQVSDDIKKYLEEMDAGQFEKESDIVSGNSSYPQFIHDYAQAMYSSLLKQLSSLKDVPTDPYTANIPKKHIAAISKKFNKKPDKVMNDVYEELERIQLYKGINENS